MPGGMGGMGNMFEMLNNPDFQSSVSLHFYLFLCSGPAVNSSLVVSVSVDDADDAESTSSADVRTLLGLSNSNYEIGVFMV